MPFIAALLSFLRAKNEQVKSNTTSGVDLDLIFNTISQVLNPLVVSWNRYAGEGNRLRPAGVPMRILTYPEQHSIVVLCGRDDTGPESSPVLQATVHPNGFVHIHEGSYGPEYVVVVLGSNLDMLLRRVVTNYMSLL